jgi:hypothetical protein
LTYTGAEDRKRENWTKRRKIGIMGINKDKDTQRDRRREKKLKKNRNGVQ